MVKITGISVKRSNGKVEKGRGVWISVSKGYVYLAYASGRVYWILTKIPVAKRPKISFSDDGLVMRLNTYKITFNKKSDYNKVKRVLLGAGRK